MTAIHAVRRVGNSRTLVGLIRVGFVGYGLFHLAIAWLAVQIALGHPSQSGDQTGAFALLRQQPGGAFILVVVVVGLAAMTLWSFTLVVTNRDRGDRLVSAGRALVYAFLAWTGFTILRGSATPSGRQQQDITATVLRHPTGQWLVGLAALIVIGISVGMIWYGAKRKFRRKLNLGSMSPALRSGMVGLGAVGYVAKGIAVGIVGVLVFDVALVNSAARQAGIDAALHMLSDLTFGTVLLVAIAAGFAAYGIYCFFQSRYRKV